MTKAEREALEQIERVICIPLPASGIQSASIRGMAQYAHEMRSATHWAWQLLCVMRDGPAYPGHLRDAITCLRDTLDDLERIRDGS
jgi:hypothetical protein